MRGRLAKGSSCACIRDDHPLRAIKLLVDGVLESLSAALTCMYARTGRPSIPPERLLKAMLLIALYSLRSERMLSEQVEANTLFRWFLDMAENEKAFNASTFSHNRRRFLEHGIAARFFRRV